MIYPAIDKMTTSVKSKYELVHYAAKRSKEMNETGHFQMSEYDSTKNIGRALEELAEGLIIIK